MIELPKPAEAYRPGIERVYSWFEERAELSQDEFDRLSVNAPWFSDVIMWQKGTWLAPFYGDRNIWYVQILMDEGYVTAIKKDGKIVYRKAKRRVSTLARRRRSAEK